MSESPAIVESNSAELATAPGDTSLVENGPLEGKRNRLNSADLPESDDTTSTIDRRTEADSRVDVNSRSRCTPAKTRSSNLFRPSQTKRLLARLSSRRTRIVGVVFGVLCVVALFVQNWPKNSSTGDSCCEPDLAEFNEGPESDSLFQSSFKEPHPPAELADESALSLVPPPLGMESGSRSPTLGRSPHSVDDRESRGIQTVGAFAPLSPAEGVSRGAWLTGQIEIDSPPQEFPKTNSSRGILRR